MSIALKRWDSYRVRPGGTVRLAGVAADATDYCDEKKAARAEVKRCRKQIDELLAALAAEEKRSLLVILQGVDGAGKDGA